MRLIVIVVAALVIYFAAATPTHVQNTNDIVQRAERGDAEAQFALANLYKGGGGGLPPDRPRAASWYMKSAQQGYAPAESMLGAWYTGGEGGLPRDDEEGRKWVDKAAQQGYREAKFQQYLRNSSSVAFLGTHPWLGAAVSWALIVTVFLLIILFCLLIFLPQFS